MLESLLLIVILLMNFVITLNLYLIVRPPLLHDIPCGNSVSNIQAEALAADITDSEIISALHSINVNKAPGVDGFNLEFFIKSWDVVGTSFLRVAHYFFRHSKMPDLFKHSLITLIPKTKSAQKVEDYRPISLCTKFYKVIAKILANRMKPVLPHIIHGEQSSFIKGRDIAENVALANEICFNMHSNMFIAKLDMFKAFDSINRNSILHRLKVKGFSETFIKWVSACILNVPFSLIINGEINGYFHSKFGLRQGCPISPLLFTVAMDAFSCMLESAVISNVYSPLRAESIHIHHLLFADDLLVTGYSDAATFSTVKKILDNLDSYLGLKINKSKSCLYIHGNLTTQSLCSRLLDIPLGQFPFKYLGLPLARTTLISHHFNGLFDKLFA